MGTNEPEYQYSNVSIMVESCLVLRHPIYQFPSSRSQSTRRTYPNIELNVFIRYCFDIESDCGDCSDGLVEFEFIQYRYGLVQFLNVLTAVRSREGRVEYEVRRTTTVS